MENNSLEFTLGDLVIIVADEIEFRWEAHVIRKNSIGIVISIRRYRIHHTDLPFRNRVSVLINGAIYNFLDSEIKLIGRN